jgi:carbamate kinase
VDPESVLIALGGHALVRPGRAVSVGEEAEAIAEAAACVVELVRGGRRVVVTHGNGPQVGHAMVRSEAGRGRAYTLPLDVCVAQTQGEIGYLLQQGIGNGLRAAGLRCEVVAVLTRVLVNGTAGSPAKPVGASLSQEEADRMRAGGVAVMVDRKRGLRRSVPSPEPLRILEEESLRRLFEGGAVVIAAGGGGIPVREEKDGSLSGVEAVVDKDLASGLLATALGVEVLLDLTSVDCVRRDFGTLIESPLRALTTTEARALLREGQFPEGTMGPKIEAAVRFLERGGRRAVITDPAHAMAGLRGEAGTCILPPAPEARP